jgi:two-component system chemotaxis response regulator CheY
VILYFENGENPGCKIAASEACMTNDLMPILVVEDSNTMGRIICGLLKQIGYQKIDLAHGGTTALAKMRSESYGLVISDWNMDPMSGLDLLKHIRSESCFTKTRFIMVTADSSMDHVVAAKSAGADGFITKPFTVQILKAKIDSACWKEKA